MDSQTTQPLYDEQSQYTLPATQPLYDEQWQYTPLATRLSDVLALFLKTLAPPDVSPREFRALAHATVDKMVSERIVADDR
jgi:hypothetical protein